MAYMSSTEASTVANPPSVIAGNMTNFNNSPGLTGGRLWMHQTTETNATLEGANFITDGKRLGMVAGDVLIMVSGGAASTAPGLLIGPIVSVTTAGVTLSSGFISSTFV